MNESAYEIIDKLPIKHTQWHFTKDENILIDLFTTMDRLNIIDVDL